VSLDSVAAMALAVVAGRTLFSARTGAVVGAVAMASNLTYNTGLQGSIKEIGVIATLAAAAALARELVAGSRPVALAVLLGIAVAAIVSVYSAAGIPYVAALLGTLGLVVLLVHGRSALRPRWLAAGAAVGVAAVVLAAPTIASILDFYRVASAVVDTAAPAGSGLGQLGAPLPLLQVGGIWLDGAYQTPISPSERAANATNIGLWVVAVLAFVSVVEMARRRRPEALLVLVPAMLTAALVAPGVVPYADAKLLAIMSPAVVFAAAIGLLGLSRVLRPAGPVVAAGLAVVLTGAIALSDAFALHDSKIAPRERMIELREAADHMAGRGPVLFNGFEEFAKYFGAGATLNVASESITLRHVELRQPDNLFGRHFDLDLQTLASVESYPNIIRRRSPAASRPPARYRRVFANRFYEAWTRGPGPKTLGHLPLQGLDDATARASCADVRALVDGAPRGAGAVLVAAHAPAQVRLDVLGAERSGGLVPDAGVPGSVTTTTPGHARGRVVVGRSGTYRGWVRGNFPRAAHVFVDGVRRVTVEGANTPEQWLGGDRLRLTAGAHAIEVRVPGGALKPGDGAAVTLGPVVFVADEPGRLETVPLARWRSLCGRELDWIELVRPLGERSSARSGS